MTTLSIGKVRTVWRGTWNSGTAYTPLDVVIWVGSSYIAQINSTNVTPSAATSSTWQLVAAKGDVRPAAATYSVNGAVLSITT